MIASQSEILASPVFQFVTELTVELVAIFLAIIAAFFIEERRSKRVAKNRAIQISEALRSELRYYIEATEGIAEKIKTGLAKWERAASSGGNPPPFYFRLEGAERPPQAAWQAALRSKILDVFDPQLVFEVGNFYHEIDGVGRRFVRYGGFVEEEILPALEDGRASFYEGDSLKPQFRASMDRLAELGKYHTKFAAWARRISDRISDEVRRLEG
jgi:hypothetical protein